MENVSENTLSKKEQGGSLGDVGGGLGGLSPPLEMKNNNNDDEG